MGDLEKWLADELNIKQLSQREAARRAGISHAYLSDILRGDKEPTCNFCLAMAKALNEPVWKLLELGGFVNNVPKNLLETEDINALLLKYNELNPNHKKELIDYIDWLLIKQK